MCRLLSPLITYRGVAAASRGCVPLAIVNLATWTVFSEGHRISLFIPNVATNQQRSEPETPTAPPQARAPCLLPAILPMGLFHPRASRTAI